MLPPKSEKRILYDDQRPLLYLPFPLPRQSALLWQPTPKIFFFSRQSREDADRSNRVNGFDSSQRQKPPTTALPKTRFPHFILRALARQITGFETKRIQNGDGEGYIDPNDTPYSNKSLRCSLR